MGSDRQACTKATAHRTVRPERVVARPRQHRLPRELRFQSLQRAYNLVQELVEIRSTPTTVEILHKGARVASHLRSRGRGQAVTNDEHRPKSHRAHLEWTPSRMMHWAQTIGPHTARLFERIMNDKPHPEMGYRGCLGIIRLAGKYSAQRVEAAAERALLTGACRYKSIESILKNSLDQTLLPPSLPSPAAPPPPHDNIRGADYFE
jgi:transposase